MYCDMLDGAIFERGSDSLVSKCLVGEAFAYCSVEAASGPLLIQKAKQFVKVGVLKEASP